MLGRDSTPTISNAQADPTPLHRRRQHDLAARRRVAQRVVEQNEQHLPQLVGVGVERTCYYAQGHCDLALGS